MEGKADRPEIFETIKSVATSEVPSKELVVEAQTRPPPEPPKPPSEGQFLCPVCDTVVQENDKVCPGCGAEFSEGESTEYECPVCKAAVPADAATCPSCGVEFAYEGETAGSPAEAAPEPPREPQPLPAATATVAAAKPTPPPAREAPAAKASRAQIASRVSALRYTVRSAQVELPHGDIKLMARELPKLVNDVKPLLLSAKRIGLDIEEGKRLINEAVQAGKRRDIERAVKLIADARRSLDAAFVNFIGGRLETFVGEVEKAQRGAPSAVDGKLEGAVQRLETADYDGAWDEFQAASEAFRSQSREYSETRSILDGDARILGEVRDLGMNVSDVERLTKESLAALDRRDLMRAVKLAKESHDRLVHDVPSFVDDQMKRARDQLLELKVRGIDLSRPVGYLKEASARAKDRQWDEALRYLREFRKEVGKVGKA